MKKVNIFCHSFQKVKPIYYVDLLHRVKYFKPLFLDILMIYDLQIIKTQNSVSQKIRLLQTRFQKSWDTVQMVNKNRMQWCGRFKFQYFIQNTT